MDKQESNWTRHGVTLIRHRFLMAWWMQRRMILWSGAVKSEAAHNTFG